MNMEITEGNKIIAVFMGYEEDPEDTLNGIKGVLHKEGKLPLYSNSQHHLYSPQYDKSWDWLMPAWEKFRSMEVMKFDMASKNAWNNHCEFIGNAIIHAPIEIAFERLVKAINWYIQNKKV